jgi:MFS transporter, DHA1 family, inner membrane transport protein
MKINFPLLALAVGAFAIGTTEFSPMGFLPEIARDLDISIPRAGMLISAYALGVMIGAYTHLWDNFHKFNLAYF